MQKHTFPNGGFVLHKLSVIKNARVSAWYTAQGALIDAEYTIGQTTRPIPARMTGVVSALQRMGSIHKPGSANTSAPPKPVTWINN